MFEEIKLWISVWDKTQSCSLINRERYVIRERYTETVTGIGNVLFFQLTGGCITIH
jgi:hypothetical protein